MKRDRGRKPNQFRSTTLSPDYDMTDKSRDIRSQSNSKASSRSAF